MTAKNKKIFLLTSMMSVFVIAATVLFAGGKFKQFKTSFAKASGTEYSVSLTRDDTFSADDTQALYKYKKTTQSGNDIYLISSSSNGQSRGSKTMCTIPRSGQSFTSPLLKFYMDAEGTQNFAHQQIESVTVKTNATISMKVQTSIDGVNFKDKYTFTCDSTGGTCSGFTQYERYILITEDTRLSDSSCGITGVDITYECQNGLSNPSLEKHYTKTISGTNDRIDMVFNSDHYGQLTFFNNSQQKTFITNYTWEICPNGLSVKLYYLSKAAGSISGDSSGYPADYNTNCLFVRYKTQTPSFYNLASIDNGQIHIWFHSTTNTSITNPDEYYKYNQKAEFTTLEVVNE